MKTLFHGLKPILVEFCIFGRKNWGMFIIKGTFIWRNMVSCVCFFFWEIKRKSFVYQFNIWTYGMAKTAQLFRTGPVIMTIVLGQRAWSVWSGSALFAMPFCQLLMTHCNISENYSVLFSVTIMVVLLLMCTSLSTCFLESSFMTFCSLPVQCSPLKIGSTLERKSFSGGAPVLQ